MQLVRMPSNSLFEASVLGLQPYSLNVLAMINTIVECCLLFRPSILEVFFLGEREIFIASAVSFKTEDPLLLDNFVKYKKILI